MNDFKVYRNPKGTSVVGAKKQNQIQKTQTQNNQDYSNYYLKEYQKKMENASLLPGIVEEKTDKPIIEKIGATVTDLGSKIISGTVGFLEGIVDTAAALGGKTADTISNISQAKNLYDLDRLVKDNNKYSEKVENFIKPNYTEQFQNNPVTQWSEENSYLSGNVVGELIGGTAQAVGQMLPAIATGQIAGKIVGSAVGQAAGQVAFGVGATGMSMQQALDEGASFDDALTYGVASGVLETLIEKASGGIGGLGEGYIGNFLQKTGNKTIAKLSSNSAFRFASRVFGEGVEEAVSEIVNPYLQRLIYDEDAPTATLEQIVESFIIGASASAVMQGTNSINKNARIQEEFNAMQDLMDMAIEAHNKKRFYDEEKIAEMINKKAERISKMVGAEIDGNALYAVNKYNYAKKLSNSRIVEDVERSKSLMESFQKDLKNMTPETRKKVIDSNNLNHIYNRNGNIRKEYTKLSEEKKSKIDKVEKILHKLDKNINIKYMYKPSNFQGYFDKSTNTININLNASDPYLTVAMHEFTHSLEKTGTYDKLRKFIINEYLSETTLQEEISKVNTESYRKAFEDTTIFKNINKDFNDKKITKEEYNKLNKEAYIEYLSEEVVANTISERLFTDENIIDKLVESNPNLAQRIFNWVKRKLSKKDSLSVEFDKKLNKAIELYKNAIDEKKTTEMEQTITNRFDSGDYKFDLRDVQKYTTTKEAKQAFIKLATDMIYKVQGKYIESKSKVKERVIKYVEDMLNVGMTLEDLGLTYEPNTVDSALKPNGEYIYTLDLSTICAKRIQFQEIWDRITRENPESLKNVDSFFKLLDSMKENHLTTPCGICFVESRRKLLGSMTDKFLKTANIENPKNANSIEAKKQILNFQEKEGVKLTSTDLMNSENLQIIKAKYPDLYAIYNRFYGANKPKLSSPPTNFTFGTITREFTNKDGSLKTELIKKINDLGGLRMLSFSDFQIEHALDFMQMIFEASTLGLKVQAYTKVPEFAAIIKNTNVKLNLSVVLSMKEDGTFDFSSIEGMDIEVAKKLRLENEDTGIIAVGPDILTTLKLMNTDFIDYVIPFHRSNLSKKEFKKVGLDGYFDFTIYQNEKESFFGTKKAKSNIPQENYWDYKVDGNTNSKNYIKYCYNNNIKPKFADVFLFNTVRKYGNKKVLFNEYLDANNIKYETFRYKGVDFVIPDGYWKLLGDYRNYDNSGKGRPQQPVKIESNVQEIIEIVQSYEGKKVSNKLSTGEYVSSEIAEALKEKTIKDFYNKIKNIKTDDDKYSIKDRSDFDEDFDIDAEMENLLDELEDFDFDGDEDSWLFEKKEIKPFEDRYEIYKKYQYDFEKITQEELDILFFSEPGDFDEFDKLLEGEVATTSFNEVYEIYKKYYDDYDNLTSREKDILYDERFNNYWDYFEQTYEKEKRRNKYESLSDEQKKIISLEKKHRLYKYFLNISKNVSREMMEYTKNSKLRVDDNNKANPDGKYPLLMLHGTPNTDMEYFDSSRIGYNGTVRGYGMNLTSSFRYARGYAGKDGKVIMSFVNITNPLNERDLTLTSEEINKLKKLGKIDGNEKLNYQSDVSLANSIYEKGKVSYKDFFGKIYETIGRDGIIHWHRAGEGTIAIAFKSNQVKDIANINPTADERFKYSIKDNQKTPNSYIIDSANLKQALVYDKKAVDEYINKLVDRLNISDDLKKAEKQEIFDYVFKEINRSKKTNNVISSEIANYLLESVEILGTGKIPAELRTDLSHEIQEDLYKLTFEKGKEASVHKMQRYMLDKVNDLKYRKKRIANSKKLVSELKEKSSVIYPDNKVAQKAKILSEKLPKYLEEMTLVKEHINNKTGKTRKIRTKIYDPQIREIITKIKQEIFDKNKTEFEGLIDPELEDALIVMSASKGSSEKLSTYELNVVKNFLAVIDKVYKQYGADFKENLDYIAQEKSLALQNKIESNPKTYEINTVKELVDNTLKPSDLLEYIEGTVSGEKSLFQEYVVKPLQEAENKYNEMYIQLTKPFEEFFKNNKKYLKSLEKEKVSILHNKITKGEAISIYLLSKRNQARGHFMSDANENAEGINLYDDKGNYRTTIVLTQNEVDNLFKTFSETDLEYIKIVEDFFNNKAKKINMQTDLEYEGYTNIDLDEYYFPIRTDKKLNNRINYGDVRAIKKFDSIFGAYFNKQVVPNATNSIYVSNVNTVVNTHIGMLSKYANYAKVVKDIDRFMNFKINDISLVETLGKRHKNINQYIQKWLTDIVAVDDISKIDSIFAKVRSNLAVAQLGLNVKVIVNQFSIYPSAAIELSPKSLIKGLTMRVSKDTLATMDKYCPYVKHRNYTNEYIRSQSNLAKEQLSKIQRVIMSLISNMDRLTIGCIFNACQQDVKKRYGLEIGTKENLKKAGELLEKVVRRTQATDTLEQPGIKRNTNPIVSFLTMYQTQNMQSFSNISKAILDIKTIKARKNTESNKKSMQKAKNKLLRNATAIITSNMLYVLIGIMFKRIVLGKKDDEETFVQEMMSDFVEANVGMIPFMNQIYGLIQGYDVNISALEVINDLRNSSNMLLNSVQTGNFRGAWYNFSKSLGSLIGVPFKNIHEYGLSVFSVFNPDLAYKYRSIWYNKSVSEYTEEYVQAIDKKDVNTSENILKEIYTEKGIQIDSAVLSKINNLNIKTNGDSLKKTLPRAVPKNTVTYNNEEYEVSDNKERLFKKAYEKDINKHLSSLVKNTKFNLLSYEEQAQAIKYIMDYIYFKNLNNVLGIDTTDNKYVLLDKCININTLCISISKCKNSLKGDKQGIQKYINSLSIPKEQKYILYGFLGYKPISDNTYVSVSTYLATKGYSFEQIQDILRFTNIIDKDGTVY